MNADQATPKSGCSLAFCPQTSRSGNLCSEHCSICITFEGLLTLGWQATLAFGKRTASDVNTFRPQMSSSLECSGTGLLTRTIQSEYLQLVKGGKVQVREGISWQRHVECVSWAVGVRHTASGWTCGTPHPPPNRPASDRRLLCGPVGCALLGCASKRLYCSRICSYTTVASLAIASSQRFSLWLCSIWAAHSEVTRVSSQPTAAHACQGPGALIIEWLNRTRHQALCPR